MSGSDRLVVNGDEVSAVITISFAISNADEESHILTAAAALACSAVKGVHPNREAKVVKCDVSSVLKKDITAEVKKSVEIF